MNIRAATVGQQMALHMLHTCSMGTCCPYNRHLLSVHADARNPYVTADAQHELLPLLPGCTEHELDNCMR